MHVGATGTNRNGFTTSGSKYPNRTTKPLLVETGQNRGGKMASNMQKLGNTLAKRMQRTASRAVPVSVELGVINPDMSLTTDTLTGKIAPKDYMIDLQLTSASYFTTTNGEHPHNHRIPSVFRRLEPGDRVIVMWVGNEPVITAIVVSGDTIS